MPHHQRVFLPGHVWHITHRCYRHQFLLQHSRERRCWRHWLWAATQRYRLCVLNYMATCNHVHLLVRDSGHGEIPLSMQLIASGTADAYRRRFPHKGSYWEPRYHATAVDSHGYLARCLVYMDLNMVRAGKVLHPVEWDLCGYRELQQGPGAEDIIDRQMLMELLQLPREEVLRREHRAWVEAALKDETHRRESCWSDSLAVGNLNFVARYQAAMGASGQQRKRLQQGEGYLLREPHPEYGSCHPQS